MLPLALWLGFGVHLGLHGLWTGLTVGLLATAILLSVRFFVLTRVAEANALRVLSQLRGAADVVGEVGGGDEDPCLRSR